MKLNKVLFGITFAAVTQSVIAAEPAPVVDVTRGNTAFKSVSIQERLDQLERKLDARNRAQVNVQRQLDELQNEVNELRGVTELHTHQLSQVLERQRELYQELDRRVSQALKPTNSVPASIEAPANSVQTNYSSNLTENEAYDRAVNMVLKEKLYDKAIPAFRAFNQNFPNSTYAANAHYWLGQLLFNKNELVEAKQEFDIVVSKFPQSSKRSDALLKLATVEQKQNNKARAVNLYQQLIKEYPNSSAAKLAQPRLSSLL
ncbi:tol-pal system protein YbgF [Colwellia sp. 1_MG-2023]|uniref:tol-pal system protein YbgF n=1 Tax=Colwellia sp. 1_MG-2023 TaxID=3062649 RepID=UPI0026E421BC|nr:tol-pal system protein YbgF [Colwellia sp. 1_MG-2023]MDO6445804.1 tol-pal system protein YbgF [Colwellia sp. 1_MG-2023]